MNQGVRAITSRVFRNPSHTSFDFLRKYDKSSAKVDGHHKGPVMRKACHVVESDSISTHRRLDCLLNRLFKHRSHKISMLYITGLCEENPPSQSARNAENVSIWWCHHGYYLWFAYHFPSNIWQEFWNHHFFHNIFIRYSDKFLFLCLIIICRNRSICPLYRPNSPLYWFVHIPKVVSPALGNGMITIVIACLSISDVTLKDIDKSYRYQTTTKQEIWTYPLGCILSVKWTHLTNRQMSHNATFCNRNVHISATKWCNVVSETGALWDLWVRSIARPCDFSSFSVPSLLLLLLPMIITRVTWKKVTLAGLSIKVNAPVRYSRNTWQLTANDL